MAPPEGLEDRLRGLILGNASTAPVSQLPQDMSDHGPNVTTDSNQNTTLNQQQQYAKNSHHKKPNQAQRRQMNSNLSIPIEQRLQGRGNVSHTSQDQQQWTAPRQNMQHQAQHYPNHQHSLNSHQPSPAYQPMSPASPYDPRTQPENYQVLSPVQPAHYVYSPTNLPHGGIDPQVKNTPGHWRSEQSPGQFAPRPQPQHRQLYQPGYHNGGRGREQPSNAFDESTIRAQTEFLQSLIDNHVNKIAIENSEIAEKEAFRVILERACRASIAEHEISLGHADFEPSTVQLKCFGSMASGFATKASDMDLALLTPLSMPRPESSESNIPRVLEKTLLDLGFGTRLLTKTRVPIIKVCEKPTKELMSDLLEERLNFEQGLLEDHSQVEHAESLGDSEQKKDDEPAETSQTPEEQSHEKQLSSLHQKQNQSLGDYYGSAKRVLFKLGGYDVGLSGMGMITLPTEKMQILNEVSKTFIHGLLDEKLRRALLSISGSAFQSPEPVSLSGVYCQAEIERLVMKWATREIQEKNERQEKLCFHNVMEWNQLTWQYPNNSSAQNRQLYQLLDRIKRISSLQFATLEQAFHEDAHQYYHRMIRILNELTNEPSLLPIIFKQYIKGISNANIRQRLTMLTQGPGVEQMTIKALLFHHSTLQLATEYERALTAGVYDAKDRLDVETYVSRVLRGPEELNWVETEAYFANFIQSPEAVELTARVKQLKEPSHRLTIRDRYYDHLAFPPDDSVGIQCDINFSADLALHNTHLLRCYAAADPRVRPLVLFVKSWASRRAINTPYRGTLSSYGYVLMVLHYLVNVAAPFVLPNLQLLRHPPPTHLSSAEAAALDMCNGLDVGFWREEEEIKELAEKKLLNNNHDSLGKLLRGFFEHYANNGGAYRGFDWGREVLSLRTQGGLLTKNDKGWVGARTTTETITTSHANPKATNSLPDGEQATTSKRIKVEEVKEIRHRYLFAIEDPFEIDHNVARTVTHNGIVSIRDEFRRAWRIIKDQGFQKGDADLDLLAEVGGTQNEAGGKSGVSECKELMDQVLEGGLRGAVARGWTASGYMAMTKGKDGGGCHS